MYLRNKTTQTMTITANIIPPAAAPPAMAWKLESRHDFIKRIRCIQ